MKDFEGIRIEDGRPVLHTGISSRDFAQAKLLHYLTECGYVAFPVKKTQGQTGDYSFEPWRFTGTAADENRAVLFLGEAFEGISLEVLLAAGKNGGEKSKTAWKTLKAVFAAQIAAEKLKIKLPWGGTSAVFTAPDGRLLFAPETVYVRSLQNHSDSIYSQFYGCTVNPLLSPEEGNAFSAASLVYRFITGSLPYEGTDTEKRSADYYDSAFLPLDLYLEKSDLTQKVNDLLGKKPRGEHRLTLEEFSAALPQEPPQKDDSASLAEKRVQYAQKLVKKTNQKRFIRKNSGIITACAVCLLLIAGGTLSFLKSQAEKETTAGLTALETIEMFYSAYNHLNIENMNVCLKGKAGKELVNFATNIYVTSRVRQAYEGLTDALTPEEWLALPEERRQKRLVFGLLNLMIDGKKANPNAVFNPERDKKIPMGTRGETLQFSADYYFLMSGADSVTTVKRTDSLILEYVKNRWQITELVSESEQADGKTIGL